MKCRMFAGFEHFWPECFVVAFSAPGVSVHWMGCPRPPLSSLDHAGQFGMMLLRHIEALEDAS